MTTYTPHRMTDLDMDRLARKVAERQRDGKSYLSPEDQADLESSGFTIAAFEERVRRYAGRLPVCTPWIPAGRPGCAMGFAASMRCSRRIPPRRRRLRRRPAPTASTPPAWKSPTPTGWKPKPSAARKGAIGCSGAIPARARPCTVPSPWAMATTSTGLWSVSIADILTVAHRPRAMTIGFGWRPARSGCWAGKGRRS